MVLTVDIGNTNIAFGLFKGKRLSKKVRLPTARIGASKDFIQKLKSEFSMYDIEAIVICSVVPKAERVLVSIFKKLFTLKPLVLGKDIYVPIRNLYKKPEQVGQDRLVNAYAAYTFYKAPLIVIDFGTAVTFDVVSKKGAYLGGVIAPGVELSLNALSEKTALLPKVKLKDVTPSIPGRTTIESMASGIFYGFASMCDGLVKRLNNKFNFKFNVIGTGGDARLISPLAKSIKEVDKDLTLKGINLVFQNRDC